MDSSVLGIVEKASLDSIKQLSRRENVFLNVFEDKKVVHAHWMTLILMFGEALRLVFKTHFSSHTAGFFASKAFRLEREEVSAERCKDFFREFANVVTGKIKLSLLDSGIVSSVSLPVLTRGFDEVFFSNPNSAVVKSWSLECENESFFCTVSMETFVEIRIEMTDKVISDDVGDVEFL